MTDWKHYMGMGKLLALIVGLPLVAYSAGIGRTVELRRTVHEQADRIEQTRHTNTEPSAALEESPVRAETTAIKDGRFLHLVSGRNGRAEVLTERYTPYQIRQEADAELYAGELVLSGDFRSLTRLLADIESHYTGNIVSVEYRITEQPPQRRKKLLMTLIVQQITREER